MLDITLQVRLGRGAGGRLWAWKPAESGNGPRITDDTAHTDSSTSCALGAFAMDETSRLGPIRVIGVIRGFPAEALIHRPSESGSGFHTLAQHGPAAGCCCHSAPGARRCGILAAA